VDAVTAPAVPGLEAAFDVEVLLGPLEDHGTTRAGHRRVVPIAGGGIGIDTRYSARTRSGGHVYLRTSGQRGGRPEILSALLRGDPAERRTTTSASASRWRPPTGPWPIWSSPSSWRPRCARRAPSATPAYRVT
jgi:hypothetical protein